MAQYEATHRKRTDQSGEPCISELTHVYRGRKVF